VRCDFFTKFDFANCEREEKMKRIIGVLAIALLLGSAGLAESAKVDYPRKGQPITMIIPWAAGASSDLGGRLLAMGMEKELGVPVLVVNKPGASGQIGLTDVAKARPDGYVIGYCAMSSAVLPYLDTSRKATFQRKELIGVAAHVGDVRAVAVSTKSPYKTIKDLAEAIKANPGKVKAGTNGAMTDCHFAQLLFAKMSGGEFGYVHFKGGGETIPALMGGHVDTYFGSSSELSRFYKSGEFRVLAILGEKESKFLPGVKTAKAQGYPVSFTTYRNIYAPGGTPREFVNILAGSIKKVMESEEHRKKMEDELSLPLEFQGPAEVEKAWDEMEENMKKLIPLARKN
jgi:tripartite-type tricarboxylate transporter receptor subunit TctC